MTDSTNALADELDAALNKYLCADNSTTKYVEEQHLKNTLWDNKAGILAALRRPIEPVEAQGRSALTQIAAECHRAKWQFDFNDENRLTVGMARDMVKRAFYELHRVGDMALKLRDTASPPSPQETRRALEPVAFINSRLTDLAEANALYGKDRQLNAPDKIARNDREISWLKDLRSIIVTARAALSTSPAPAEDMRASVIEALKSIAGWRQVNISNEYESGLRSIIRSITDCAQSALEIALSTIPDPKQAMQDGGGK